MIRHLKNKEIDRNAWDACILGSANPLAYGQAWFLDIVSPGWEALVKNDYESVFPLTQSRKLGFSYLRQPFFCQQLGIFSKESVLENGNEFYSALQNKYSLIDINLNTGSPPPSQDFEIRKNLNLELSLHKTYSELHDTFSENARRNISKSGSQGFWITSSVCIDNLIKLFKKNKGLRVKKIPRHAWQMLKKVVERSRSSNQGELFGLEHPEHGFCAGAFFLFSGNRAIFLFSAISEKGKETGAMFYLIDRFIRQNSKKQLILDFEGSNDPGLARFYRGFGAEETHYYSLWQNNLPRMVRWMKNGKGPE
jgi:hypothetical protein